MYYSGIQEYLKYVNCGHLPLSSTAGSSVVDFWTGSVFWVRGGGLVKMRWVGFGRKGVRGVGFGGFGVG